MNFSNRILNNALFNSLSWAMPVAVNFVFLPYTVHKLGAEAYGVLTMIWTVIGYFTFLEFGMGNAVVKYVAEYNGSGDTSKVNEIIGTAVLLCLILGLTGGAAILATSNLIMSEFFKVPAELIPLACAAFSIGAVGFLANILLSVFQEVPNGLNRYDITSRVSVAMGASTATLTALLLYLGYGLMEIVVMTILVTISGLTAYFVIAKRLMPSVRFRPVISRPAMKIVLNFGFFTFLSRVAYLINFQIDRLVIAALLGVSSVTYYVVPFLMISKITDITFKLGIVIFPAISELQGSNRFDRVVDLYLTASRVILAVSTSICLPILLFGGQLLSLWMGLEFGQNARTVMLLLTLGLYAGTLTNIPTFVVNGLGQPRVSGLAALVGACLNLVLLIPMAKLWGLEGIAGSFCVSNGLMAPIFILYVNNHILGLKTSRLLLDAYLKPAFAAILLATVASLIPVGKVDNIFAMIGIMASTTLGYFVLCGLIGVFPQRERKFMVDHLKLMFARK